MHKVLLIEDNAGDARLIREMLGEDPDAPFELDCADRLSSGLERLAAGDLSLVLLDLSLPDSFGLETFAKVFAHSPLVPIIVLTGNEKAFAAGADIKEMRQRSFTDVYLSDFITTSWERITRCRKPVIAAAAEASPEEEESSPSARSAAGPRPERSTGSRQRARMRSARQASTLRTTSTSSWASSIAGTTSSRCSRAWP